MQSRGAIFLFCEVFGQFSLSYIHNLDYMYVGTVNNISDSSPNEETSSSHFQLSQMIFIDELQESLNHSLLQSQ